MIPVRRLEFVCGIAIGLLFLTPLLVYGPFDEEEAALGIFASQVHYQALLQGHWLFWLNNLGFGTPLPIGSRLDFHPVFALAATASLRTTLSALWLTHVTVMVVYFLRLASVTGIRPPLRMILLACYVFSAVSVCHWYVNDWVTHVIGWSLYPVLVFYLRQAVCGEAVTDWWLAAVRLSLLFGFWFLNSHPGYIAPVVLPLVVYTIAAAPARRPVYLCLLVGSVLCVAICAERLYFFASEMRVFPALLSRTNTPGYTPIDYAAAAIAPFAPVRTNMRLPFIGLVLGLAALASVLRFRKVRTAHVRACTVAFVAALVLSLTPSWLMVSLWNAPAGAWNFRDPMLFFGLLAGGLVLQRGLDSPRTWRRAFTWMLLTLQVCQQGATIWPGFRGYFDQRGILQFYQHQGHAVGLGRVLVRQADTFGPRLYLSERAQFLMRGALSVYGIHFVTDLVFLGLNPINAWFKSVSMDRLYPSFALMNGYIGGQRDVIENAALLDVLGINMVLTTEAEGPDPSGLLALERTHVVTHRGQDDLVLFANPDAWPHAVLMETDALTVTLPLRPGCGHQGALCRDYGLLADKRLPGSVSMTTSNGRYTARLAPAARERLLFVSATYRPEWQATSSAGTLRIDPVAGAFLGVNVPPGVDNIEIAFVPRVRIALTWFSGLTLLVLLTIFCAASWRRGRSPRERPSIST